MSAVRACALPAAALLHDSVAQGAYADCFCIDVPVAVSHAAFVEAFYTTPVFRVERWILRWALSRPSSDADAHRLATGACDTFAAWIVRGRAPDQLHLVDVIGRTQSWLMVAAVGDDAAPGGTRLYFGSAVMPARGRAKASVRRGWLFRSLLGFHTLYSRVLLSAARSRVLAMRRG